MPSCHAGMEIRHASRAGGDQENRTAVPFFLKIRSTMKYHKLQPVWFKDGQNNCLKATAKQEQNDQHKALQETPVTES